MTGQVDHASNPKARRKARDGERKMHAERERQVTETTSSAASGTDDAAELAKLRRAVQTLSHIVGSNMQVMEAARIEMHQSGPHTAMQWIINSLPGLWDDPDTKWDGEESAQAWFDRTESAYRSPELLADATAPHSGYRQLLPEERLAVSMASAQLARGENPPVNTTAMLLLTLQRLTGDGTQERTEEGQ